MIDTPIEDKLKKAYETLSSVSNRAYYDLYLLSNQVLSKNPLSNNFLKYFLADVKISPYKFHTLFNKLIKYYLNSFFQYAVYIAKFLICRIEKVRYDPTEVDGELIIIDTFFLSDSIVKSEQYAELYFPGLDHVLKTMGKPYAYLPVFYGSKDLSTFHSAIKIIKRARIPVLSEFQLLSLIDFLHLFSFILTYPWHVLCFMKTLEENDPDTELVKHELVDTLDQVTFLNFSRYLQGKRIADLPYKSIKLISWYENQTIDKNLYKGVRINRRKVVVYGAQLFLFSKMALNIFIDEKEKKFNIIPDRIIVNGPYFVPKSSHLHYAIGPSLRYSDLFKTSVQSEKQKDILVLLPYSYEISENILRMLSEVDQASRQFVVKAHPTAIVDELRHWLQPGWHIVHDSIYSLFKKARMVIGSSSGSLVEAASLGIQVICVKIQNDIDYVMLPELGKGILWEEANNIIELESHIKKFENYQERDFKKMMEISVKYKKTFFCEPTAEKIIEAFDL